jgi:hypothetical protein
MRLQPSPKAVGCRARVGAAGRRGAPLLSGGGVGVKWCSGGEGVEQEGHGAILSLVARCMVHPVRRVREKGVASTDWRRRAVSYVAGRRCHAVDACVRRLQRERGRDSTVASLSVKCSTERHDTASSMGSRGMDGACACACPGVLARVSRPR